MSILEFNRRVGLSSRLSGSSERRSDERSKLRALVLLGGQLRPSPFAAAIGRSLLDLPVDAHHSVLDLWRAHGAIVTAYTRSEKIAMRVITNGVRPKARTQAQAMPISIEADPFELRGPGGVLRDVAESYADDDVIAVATANQLLMESLPHLLGELEATGGDVSLLAHDDGTPAGLMLARCGALRSIPSIGFVDLKEQGLPLIAKQAAVKVLRRQEPVALPLRTSADYLGALRQYHLRFPSHTKGHGRFSEAWSAAFAVCERGSHVHASARIHDSVVLKGGRVEAGAMVARSVICSGAVVRRDQVVVDQIVTTVPAAQRVW